MTTPPTAAALDELERLAVATGRVLNRLLQDPTVNLAGRPDGEFVAIMDVVEAAISGVLTEWAGYVDRPPVPPRGY
jgi:hypothetical protein